MNVYTVVTLFPDFIAAFATTGVIGRAQEHGQVVIDTVDPRMHARDAHGRIDDAPYGGGPGMVMAVPPLRAAIETAQSRRPAPSTVAYLTPQGRRIDQSLIAELGGVEHLVLVAGRYEGIDERIIDRDVDIELSLGDFVMTGGEIAAMALIDGIVRLLPGTLGCELSPLSDSFSAGLLEYPQYTRPETVDGQTVPAVLLSGDHQAIERWRRKHALGRTWVRRPDLLEGHPLEPADRALLEEFKAEMRGPDDPGPDGD